MDMDDAARQAGQHIGQLVITATRLTQRMQARRAAQARDEQHQQQHQQDEITRRLSADRATHAGQWERLIAQPDTPLDGTELATHWTAAAAWEPHDTRAGQARRILDDRLAANGIPQQELNQERSETQRADLLANTQQQPVVIDKDSRAWTSDDHKLWSLVTSGTDHGGGIEWTELADRIDTEATAKMHKTLGMTMPDATTDHLDNREMDRNDPDTLTGQVQHLTDDRDQHQEGTEHGSDTQPKTDPSPVEGHQVMDAVLRDVGFDAEQRNHLQANPSVAWVGEQLAEKSRALDTAQPQTPDASDATTASGADADTGPDPAGNVYAGGAEPARLAGESFPDSTAEAVARTGKHARPRAAKPTAQRDHGRSR